MEIISSSFDGSLNRYMRRRRYQHLDGSYRKKMKVIRIGGSPQRFWKIKTTPRLISLKLCSQLIKFWRKFKNAYVNMMLSLGGSRGEFNNGNYIFGGKRIPKARQASTKYSSDEFQKRLIYEIYKNLMPSRELATI